MPNIAHIQIYCPLSTIDMDHISDVENLGLYRQINLCKRNGGFNWKLASMLISG